MISNVLFLGEFPSSELIKKSGGKIDSLYRDSQAIIEGLRKQENVRIDVITIPDIAAFPQQRLYLKSFYDNTDHIYSLPLLNLPFIKQLWIVFVLFIVGLKVVSRNKGVTYVICPYIVFHHILAARLIKFFNRKHVKVLTVVPDIFFPKNTIKRWMNKYSEYLAKKSDSFVLYTKAMADYLGIVPQKFVIIEGFYKIKDLKFTRHNPNVFTITYTGTLNKKYGILRLLESMNYIPYKDIDLRLYGSGDAVDIIKEFSRKDYRIQYMGQVPKEEAVKALYSSSVLVNPRNSSDGEYVQFSFPSKDIEYMGTGVPAILCKLPSMPTEYFGYFLDAKDGSPLDIAQAIIKAYQMTKEERDNLGLQSKLFIEQRMNTVIQGREILKLIMNQ